MGYSGNLEEIPDWNLERTAAALGEPAARLIATVAGRASAVDAPIYLAGGVVRDLMLGRKNLDLDFVLESDAIGFAGALARTYGGEIERHTPFGTAKWKLDEGAIDKLSAVSGEIPEQIDFATARTERYDAPAALPTVRRSSILQDLQRRDFTVNALALRIGAGPRPWQLLDPCKGYGDIIDMKIRVLHDGSFVDDPTRIFRAYRFARRFGFTIENDTAVLLREALPNIQRLSAERIRHELDLILREAYPERIIADLYELGVFSQVQDAFRIGPGLSERFKQARDYARKTNASIDEAARLHWHLLFAGIKESDVLLICERLNLTQALSRSSAGFARLLSAIAWLGSLSTKPSQLTRFLDGISETALTAGLICTVDAPVVNERIQTYMEDWRYRRPTIDGNELLRAGLEPGPVYREILDRLRSAWIDGEIESDDQERELFLKLVREAD